MDTTKTQNTLNPQTRRDSLNILHSNAACEARMEPCDLEIE